MNRALSRSTRELARQSFQFRRPANHFLRRQVLPGLQLVELLEVALLVSKRTDLPKLSAGEMTIWLPFTSTIFALDVEALPGDRSVPG